MKRFNFAIGLAVLALALGLGAYYYSNSGKDLSLTVRNEDLGGQAEITKVSANAFGSLVSAQVSVRSQSGGGGSPQFTSDVNKEQSGVVPEPAAPLGLGGGAGGGMGMMPVYYDYRFVYKGEPLDLSDTAVSVLRRQLGENTSGDLKNYLLSNNFGLADFGSFADVKMQSYNFTEDRDHGYNVTVNFADGSISLNEDFTRWTDAHVMCEDEACSENSRIRPGDIPSDDQVIAIADNFLKNYGIATQNYGEPYVDDNWRLYYEQSADRSGYYLPEVVNVIYPLLVDGREVRDESGNPTGINLSVNVRVNAVTGMWGLTTQRYDASSYAAETDANRIIKIAEAGGFRSYYPLADNNDAKSIALGTPERSLVKIYNYQNGINQELLVPALVFPAEGVSDLYYSPKFVVVPLVEELLNDPSYPNIYQLK